MASVTASVRSGDQKIDGLLSDYRWSAPQPLTYGFPSLGGWSGYADGGEPATGFAPLNAAQQAAVVAILNEIERFADVDFAAAADPNSATLRFGMTDATESAHAYTPYFDEIAGDVWFNRTSGAYDDPRPGNYDYFGLLHEIGHALGLKHPHETELFGAMPLSHDHMAYTVMSYRSYQAAPLDGYSNFDHSYAQSFMMYDIAALQHLYGANFETASDDTRYSWNPSTGQLSINGVAGLMPAGNKVFMTVWDGGGDDTYDFSLYEAPIKLDLNPGAWIDLGGWQRPILTGGHGYIPASLANALLYKGDPRSLIENAKTGSWDDELIGNAAPNRLSSGDGDDELDGRGGADTMIGGRGSDLYIVGDPGDRVIEARGGGYSDTVHTKTSFYQLEPNVENLEGLGGGPQHLVGNELRNVIQARVGGGILDGGEGADELRGTRGADTYIVDNKGDRILDDRGGRDLVISSITYGLNGEMEDLTLTGSRPAAAYGNHKSNTLTGNDAANLLDGGGGVDVMKGGGGDDTYVVDRGRDRTIEAAGAGTDTVVSSVAFVLQPAVENLTLTGEAALAGTGNALDNHLIGNGADNLLSGGGGDDLIEGGAGNDRLRGQAGRDLLKGGLGDDIYVVADPNETVVEFLDQGADTVLSSVSFALSAHVETLVLTGSGAIDGSGNGSDNSLTGNRAANRLDGRAGNDVMTGGGGHDVYVVDIAGDQVIEQAGGGVDLVLSSVALALGSNVENLTLAGSAAIAGTGNGLVNFITGNGASNLLRGLAGDDVIVGKGGGDQLAGGPGADLMKGGGGDDLYIVDDLLDEVFEFAKAGGADLVKSSVAFTLGRFVDDLTLTGGAASAGAGNGADNAVTGNKAANVLSGRGGDDLLKGAGGADTLLGGKDDDLLQGGAGNDFLSGGKGRDQLRGGSGADRFVFDQAPGPTHADEIFDFDRGSDKIALENAVFRGLAEGKLPAGALAIGTKALNADDRIVYDPATGKLFFDPDGAGGAAASLFAVLDNQPAILAASDFVVI